MERAGNVLKTFLREKGIEKGNSTSSLFSSWSDMVGPVLSEHTRIVDIAGNHLIVEVDHPGWFQTLRFIEKEIINKVNGKYPEVDIKGLRMRFVSKESPEKSVAAEKKSSIEPSADDIKDNIKDNVKSIDDIKDAALRMSLKRLYKGICAENIYQKKGKTET
jgi:hypothetical protein